MRKMLKLFVGLLFLHVIAFGESKADFSVQPRLFRSNNAVLGQFPHMACLRIWTRNSWSHSCGGSLINSNWILTAAHCLIDLTEDQIKVYLGTVMTRGDDGDVYDADLLLIHPDFAQDGLTPKHDDIGLVKLTKSVTLTPNVKPIQLSHEVVKSDLEVTVTGFGLTENGKNPEILQYLTQTVWDNERCNNTLKTSDFNKENLCAINGHGKGACTGDSGGPLISGNQQVGITSWVRAPCASNHPDVYVRVSDYFDWISLQIAIHG